MKGMPEMYIIMPSPAAAAPVPSSTAAKNTAHVEIGTSTQVGAAVESTT